MDENGLISRSKARLVAKRYNHAEGIGYEDTYALVACLEVIRLLLTFACYMDFKLYQMDIKSAFLNGHIKEEVYILQPLGFKDHNTLNHVFKLKRAIYGLKQAPRAWYEQLSGFLLLNNDSIVGKSTPYCLYDVRKTYSISSNLCR